MSLTFENPSPFELSIQGIPCTFALRPVHTDETKQRTHGGTFIAVDFSLTEGTDLLIAIKQGLDIVDDFFAGLSVIEGATFRDVEPIEIVRCDDATSQEYTLVHFLNLSMHHWERPISQSVIDDVRGLLAHWDGLDSGKRLRRAAKQYHKAISAENNLAAFQHAYMGLEALEKPLANAADTPPGVEVMKGKCENCGAEYSRKRTLLAGVRAYVLGDIHNETATLERSQEWKDINGLRQKLFHSLDDITDLEQESLRVVSASMHYLHDAICCLSHAHDLESVEFKLARGMRNIILVGKFNSEDLGPLEQCRPIIDSEGSCWVEHSKHGFVPEFNITVTKNLEAQFFWLNEPLGSQTEKDLVKANWEP